MLARSNVIVSCTAAAVAFTYFAGANFNKRGPERKKCRILVVAPESTAFSQALARGAASAAHELNLAVSEQPATGSLQATTTSADATLLVLESGLPLPPFAEELNADASLLTCGPGESPRIGRGHIGVSNFGKGAGCASYLARLCPQGGKVIVLVDDQNVKESFNCLQGIRWQVQRRHAWTPLDLFVCDDDHGESNTCLTNARNALRAHPQAVCIVDLSRRLKESVAEKLSELTARSGVKLVMFDQSDAALAGIESGRIQGVIADDPFALGRCAARLLAEFHDAAEMGLPAPGRALLHCPSIVVHARNVSKYRSHLGPGWTCAGSADIRL